MTCIKSLKGRLQPLYRAKHFLAALVALVSASVPVAGATQAQAHESDTKQEPVSIASEDEAAVPPDAAEDLDPLSDEGTNIYALLDLEELMAVTVTSATGVARPWFRTPAAITVLTAEEIRQAGHRSIPEALRLVPGLHVARVDAGMWAISARGFSSEFANKLQVLMDGRRLYDPLFSGVYWDVQDYIMEDIHRIEVIRGPGATLWGANAVNGVINITTKSAADTQGWLITGGGGNVELGFGAVRFGGKINDEAHFRIYGKYRNFDSMMTVDAGRRPDDWDMWQGGFRFDFGSPQDGELTIQGDVFHLPKRGTRRFVADPMTHFGQISETAREGATGGNFLARLHREASENSSWTLLAYYDRLDRPSSSGFRYTRDSFDVDFRHYWQLGDRHELVWGLNLRHDRLDTESTEGFMFSPSSRSVNTFSGFIQDTITFVPDRLFGMVGTKLEHNDFSGFEVQPSARVWWTPDAKQTVWASVSRPVRTPSWVEQDVSILFAYADPGLLMGDPPAGFLVPLFLSGDPELDSEKLMAWELGYRRRITDALTVDIAGFYNRYSNMSDFEGAVWANPGRANVYGVELAAQWDVADNWSLTGSYSLLDIDATSSFSGDAWEGSSPQHQFQLHSRLDITKNLEFNAGLYFVDRLRALEVDEHFRLDLGLTWRPRPNVELSIWGQNLLERRHVEFESPFLDSPAQVERSIAAQATFRF